jgi:hypothetical protein
LVVWFERRGRQYSKKVKQSSECEEGYKKWLTWIYGSTTSQGKAEQSLAEATTTTTTPSNIKAAANNDQNKPQLHCIMHTKSCHVMSCHVQVQAPSPSSKSKLQA